jgi:hypothetical protein
LRLSISGRRLSNGGSHRQQRKPVILKAFLDGLASLLAALATLAICDGPAYFTYQAIQSMIAPAWAWVSVAALVGIGIVLTIAFLRKAFMGIAPTRERRRK